MNTTPSDSAAPTGDSLLALMAVAVLVGSAAIAGLGILGSWWLLPLAVLTVIAFAIAVAYSLMHLMGDDKPAGH
jgi:hypothetical protein